MLSSAYPIPPSRLWSLVLAVTYLVLVIAGGLVLALLAIIPQAIEGVLVLGLWGVLMTPSALACFYGVARSRYRFEWIGTWGIVMGTSIYLVVTLMGTTGLGLMRLLQSLPTILIFVAFVGLVLARAIQLSLIDIRARRQVLAEKALTGEIPEVSE